MATFFKKSLGNFYSLRPAQKKNRLRKFPFIAANNWIIFAFRYSVKHFFFCSEFPFIPEKFWRKEEDRGNYKVWCFLSKRKNLEINQYSNFDPVINNVKDLTFLQFKTNARTELNLLLKKWIWQVLKEKFITWK